MKYETFFVWRNRTELDVFYKITAPGGIVSYVPTGVEFKHRNKTYSTAAVISMLPRMIGGRGKTKKIPNYVPTDWYVVDSRRQTTTIDRAKFIELQNAIACVA